jgi:hypothetical protein
MNDGFGVAWVVDGFHPYDDFRQLGIMDANVLDQFGLCVPGYRNENGADIRRRSS